MSFFAAFQVSSVILYVCHPFVLRKECTHALEKLNMFMIIIFHRADLFISLADGASNNDFTFSYVSHFETVKLLKVFCTLNIFSGEVNGLNQFPILLLYHLDHFITFGSRIYPDFFSLFKFFFGGAVLILLSFSVYISNDLQQGGDWAFLPSTK